MRARSISVSSKMRVLAEKEYERLLQRAADYLRKPKVRSRAEGQHSSLKSLEFFNEHWPERAQSTGKSVSCDEF